MLLDYHVHPDYSIDAIGSMREYVDSALKKGLQEICFTTHLDLVPERIDIDGFVRLDGKQVSVKDDWIPRYLEEIQDLNKAYQSITILSGVEIDYHPDIVKDIEKIVRTHPFDYVLGAVHSLDGYSIAVPEDCHAFCKNRKPEEVCHVYYNLVIEAIKCELFDTIAHLDLYKRFSYSIYGPSINRAHRTIWHKVLKAFSDSNVGIEINTGNWRKGVSEPSPSRDLLDDLFGCGLSIITVGSDAHHPNLVGRDISRAYEWAKSAGFTGISRFRKRQADLAFSFQRSDETVAE